MDGDRTMPRLPASHGNSGSARVTQRAPQSCQRCSAKKMRCSKTVPCDACVGQGMALQCRREQVIVTKHIRSAKSQQQKARSAAGVVNPAGPSLGRTTRGLQQPEPRQTSPDHEETAAVLLDLSQHQPHHPHDLNLGYVFDIDRPGPSSLDHTSRRHEDAGSPTSPSYHLGSQQWSVPSDYDEPAHVSSPDTEVSPFEATVTSLEFMVWGRQRDSGVPAPSAVPHVQDDTDGIVLSPQQAAEVIKYHWKWLTWTHNMIHWPQFQEECHLYWNDGFVKENAWVALYYAVLCVGIHHMTMDQRTELGLAPGADIAEQLYHKCVEALKEADYAAVHSLVSVQTISLLVLCAHDFNGSNLLAVLLSSAIRIAQSLNIHRLGPDPVELHYRDRIQREIRKSIWMFLSTQDSFMIPFSNSHSISLSYCNTPAPLNCNAICGAGANGRNDPFKPVSTEQPTAMSYQLIMHKVAQVYRSFFDQTSSLPGNLDSDTAMRRLYDHVLKADSEISDILKTLPRYLRLDYTETNIRLPCYIPRQRYHFAISVAHKTISIHRKFFLRSLTDKWYNYTKITCVNCARTILTQFRANSDESTSRNLWTVLAHVVCASIILLLEALFSHEATPSDDTNSTRQLVHDCLAILKASNNSSSMSVRGIDLIEYLLGRAYIPGRAGVGFPEVAVNSLNLAEIAAYLALDKSVRRMDDYAAGLGSNVDLDLGDLDSWMQFFA